jgi:hypothetical protein
MTGVRLLDRPKLTDAERHDAQHARTASCRLWAVFMIARSLESAESIVRRLPLRAGNLDGVVLRHALRGQRLPHPDTYLPVTAEMLDAVSEVESVLVARKAGFDERS